MQVSKNIMTTKFRILTGGMTIVSTSFLFALYGCHNDNGKSSSTPSSGPPKDSLSYSLGNVIGQRIKDEFSDLNISSVTRGLQDALDGKQAALEKEEMQKIIEKAQQEQFAKSKKKLEEDAKENTIESEKFLVENAKKPNIVTTDSGLQYKDLTHSLTEEDKKQLLSYLSTPVSTSAEKPTKDSTVTVSYVGSYPEKEGKMHVFDSSEKHKKPAVFQISQVVSGWQEGLQLMHVGQTFEFFIPPKLGYGDRGIPGFIPPSTVLRFKVTLIKVDHQPPGHEQDKKSPKSEENDAQHDAHDEASAAGEAHQGDDDGTDEHHANDDGSDEE